MNILFVITSWSFGGAEMQVLDLADAMQSINHKVMVVSIIDPDNEFIKGSDNRGIYVKSLKIKKGSPDFRAVFKLRKIIKDFKPNILHAHMVHSVILSRVTRLIVKIPRLISTAHSINEGGRLRDLMYRYTDFLSDINTNVSIIGTELYIQKKLFSKNKTYFMPNGIELPCNDMTSSKIKIMKEVLGIDEKVFVWLAIGRIEEAKDYINLLEAVKELKIDSCSDFIVLIAGEGSLRKLITNKIKDFDLEKQVVVLGRRNDVPDLLQMADAFVMSSAWEGLPIAILEAASYGLPAVVTDVGGCKEIIEDKCNGYVVPSKRPKKLSEALYSMMQLSKDEIKKMSSFSIRKIQEDYILQNVVKKWLNLYSNK